MHGRRFDRMGSSADLGRHMSGLEQLQITDLGS